MKKENDKTTTIYQVDLVRLTVKTYKMAEETQFAPTFEDFNIAQCSNNVKLDLNTEQLPKKIGNYVYFGNNDEALKYIKNLIGM